MRILNEILKKFLNKNKKTLIIIILGEIFIFEKIKKKFKLKKNKMHSLLNIYNYKYH